MKETESPEVKNFKDWKQAFSLMPYNTQKERKFCIESVISFLDKCKLQHMNNMNSFYDNENQIADRLKLINAISYILSADLLPGKRIFIPNRILENFVFYIDTVLKMKNKL